MQSRPELFRIPKPWPSRLFSEQTASLATVSNSRYVNQLGFRSQHRGLEPPRSRVHSYLLPARTFQPLLPCQPYTRNLTLLSNPVKCLIPDPPRATLRHHPTRPPLKSFTHTQSERLFPFRVEPSQSSNRIMLLDWVPSHSLL